MRRWKIKVGQIVACSFCGEWGRIDAFSVPCKDGKLDRGRRGPALQGFDVGGYRDRFNVFKVPVPASFTPGQKLLDRAVISGSGRYRYQSPDGDSLVCRTEDSHT
jgi:hypothetical protein